MRRTAIAAALLVGGLCALAALDARGVVEASCDQIVATMEQGGGALSADEAAKKLGVPVERVRECMAQTGGGKPSKVNPNPYGGPTSGGGGAKPGAAQ